MPIFGRRSRPSGDYDWETVSSGYTPDKAGAGVAAWILAALAVSGVLHLVLFAMAGKVDWEKWSGSSLDQDQYREIRDRVAINPELMQKGEVIKDLKPTEEERPDNELANIDEELSLLEAQEKLQEKEIKLTPEIDAPENYLAEEGPTRPAVDAADLLKALEAVESGGVERSLEKDVASMKSRMAETGRVSDKQMTLAAGPELGADFLDQDFLSEDEAPSGLGAGIEGFSDLDQLLAMTGGLPANLDPVLMPTDLLFGYNQIQVQETARLSLMKLGLLIQKNPDSDFTIEGHSDSFGGADYNLELSRKRAEAVRDWLVSSLQLDSQLLKAVGRGQTAHLADASGSIEEQAINRRVEIVIKPRKK